MAPQEKETSAKTAFNADSVHEFANPDKPWDWWYFNSTMKSPGNPIDGWAVISIFCQLPKVHNEYVIQFVVPPSQEVINNTRFLSPGQMKTDASKLDVSIEGSWIHGGYPDYEWHVEGKIDGRKYELQLQNKADMAPLKKRFQYSGVFSYFDQFAVFRTKQEGSFKLGDKTYPVTGEGYYEHCYGDVNPEEAKGWYWYFVPGGVSQVDINVFMLVDKDKELNPRNVDFTVDGKTYHMFEDCEFEPLSWTDVEGHVGYANKYRVTKKTADGELDITITRDKYAGQLAAPAALFVTGFVETTGFLEWKGVRYEVNSRSIGSAAVLS